MSPKQMLVQYWLNQSRSPNKEKELCKQLVKSKGVQCKILWWQRISCNQQENLEMFGVANVCIGDGFSGKIVGHAID